MKTLIQTSICSIVYGDWKGKPNQELFRCPRACDELDLRRYVNEQRDFFGFEPDGTEDLRNVSGYEMIGYYRMYYRDGWCGKWFIEKGNPDRRDCYGVQCIIDSICKEFPKGCTGKMKQYFSDRFIPCSDNRYILRPRYSDYYKVLIDTKYGNGDYPVRIYTYRKARA